MFELCCHSNATRTPIANPPNSAQAGGISYHSKLHPGPCNSVGMGLQTDTQTRVTTIHLVLSTTHMKHNKAIVDNMTLPPVMPPGDSLGVHTLSTDFVYQLRANVTSSTTLEIHNVLHCWHSRFLHSSCHSVVRHVAACSSHSKLPLPTGNRDAI